MEGGKAINRTVAYTERAVARVREAGVVLNRANVRSTEWRAPQSGQRAGRGDIRYRPFTLHPLALIAPLIVALPS